jgi:hypothetical protein
MPPQSSGEQASWPPVQRLADGEGKPVVLPAVGQAFEQPGMFFTFTPESRSSSPGIRKQNQQQTDDEAI